MSGQYVVSLFAIGTLAGASGCGRSDPRRQIAPPAVDAAGVADAVDGPSGDDRVNKPDDAPGNERRVPYRALAVAAGRYHTCVLLDDHNVKCWGGNDYGQLGLGDMVSRGKLPEQMGDALPRIDLGVGRTATAIAAGRYATCATLDNQVLKCWGWGGLTGHPELKNSGDAPGEMGDNLPPLDLGPGRTAKVVTIGTYQGCAVLDDDSLKCWGAQETPRAVALPAGAKAAGASECPNGMCALLDDGSVLRRIVSSDPPVTPEKVDLGVGAAAHSIAGDELMGCALLRGGGAFCWGDSQPPFSRGPAPTADLTALVVGMGFSCGLEPGGAVTCRRGPPNVAQWEGDTPGSVRLGQPAKQISAGWHHVCALLADGSVKCWGRDTLGSLGADPAATSWLPINLGTRPAH